MAEILVMFSCGHMKDYMRSVPDDEKPVCPTCGDDMQCCALDNAGDAHVKVCQ